MDLDSLTQTVKFLKKYSDCEMKVLSLQKLVDEKNAYIVLLEQKLKAFTDNTKLKSYISGLEEKIKSLQTTIEKLEIVIPTKVNDSTVISHSFTNDSLKRTYTETNSLCSIISEKKVWNCIQNYLASEDIMNLFLTSKAIRVELSQNIRVFAKLLKNLSIPIPVVPNKPLEIQGLLKR